MKEGFFKKNLQKIIELVISSGAMLVGSGWYILQQNFPKLQFFGINPVVSSVSVASLLFTWSLFWSSYNADVKRDDESKKINQRLDSLFLSGNFETYGSIDECINHVNSRIPVIVDVRNTCVVTDNFDTWLEKSHDLIIKQVASIANSGHEWRDIVSSNMIEPRVNKIREKINNNRKDKYRPMVLKHDISIINFIIVTYKNINGKYEQEVFFGFGLHELSQDDFIYHTSNSDVVATFEAYHQALRRFHCNEISSG